MTTDNLAEQPIEAVEEDTGPTIADIIHSQQTLNRVPTEEQQESQEEEEGKEENQEEQEYQSSEEQSSAEEEASDGEPEPRWKTLKEAEKSFKEAERKMHEATQRAAKLERELEATRDSEQPSKKSEQQPAEDGEMAKLDDLEVKIANQTAEDINALDQDAEDYNVQVLKLMAKQQSEIAKIEMRRERIQSKRQQDMIQTIEDRLSDEGLSEFAEEFWTLGSVVPTDIKGIDAQIDWGIEKIKALRAKVQTLVEKTAPPAKKEKEEDFSLGRGGKGQPAMKEEGVTDDPGSLAQDIKNLHNLRTIPR